MAYSTPAQVRQALVATSDGSLPAQPTHTAADYTDEQLTDSITQADALIDGYIGGFYATPVTEPGEPLAFWSRTIAAYLATLTFKGSLDLSDSDPVVRRYQIVLTNLKDVAAGRMKLNFPGNDGPSKVAGVGQVVNPDTGPYELFPASDFDIDPAPHYPDWGYGARLM